MAAPKFTIDTTHGVVANANPACFAHRNLLDRDRLERHFRRRTQPYVPLATAIADGGDAFTLDDSTVTAADAARLARACGHAVTIFINGSNIETRQPYFFSQLNMVLDATRATSVQYQGRAFDLQTMAAKEKFRVVVKRQLSKLAREEDRQALVASIGRLLGIDRIDVPSYLQPITLAELRELVALGVDIQNHGWSHVRVGALPPAAHAEEIARGRQWLLNQCGVDADLFAVPNGDGLPFWGASPHFRIWFLLATNAPLGEVAPGVINRSTLEV